MIVDNEETETIQPGASVDGSVKNSRPSSGDSMMEEDGGRITVVASVIYRPDELKKEVEELAKFLREAMITALTKKKPHIHINPLHTSTSIRSSQSQRGRCFSP